MADSDKVAESPIDDSQATYDPSLENNSLQQHPTESAIVSESQDFELIDCEESQKATQEEIVEKKEEPSNEKVQSAECLKIEAEQPPSSKDETFQEKNGEKAQEENDDEIDFIPSSQQETLSPMKKQLSSSLVGEIGQKRKVQTVEEDNNDQAELQRVAKFQRTCSREDALSSVRKKFDTENFVAETVKEEEEEAAAVIEETPAESCTEETESLHQVQQQLVETLSQYVDPGEELKTNEKSSPRKKKEAPSSNEIIISSEKDVTEKSSSLDSVKCCSNEKESSNKKQPKDSPDDYSIVEKNALPEVPVNNEVVPEETVVENDKKDKESSNCKIGKSDDSGFDSMKMELDSTARVVTETSSSRSRMSIEVIYDKATAPPKRPRELVEIDEDGEKIVLDSSQEGCDEKSIDKIDNTKSFDSSYKSLESKESSTEYKSIEASKDSTTSNKNKSSSSELTNGSDIKKIDSSSGSTLSATSDLLQHTTSWSTSKLEPPQSPVKKSVTNLGPPSLVSSNPEVLSVSDSDGDSFLVEERNNKLESSNKVSSNVKLFTIEKEINVLVKLKCFIEIDENTKEHVNKVLTGVHCEPAIPDLSSIRRRNSDTSACLADISGNDNKDASLSPGSVTSNAQPYALNTRMSLASTISSSSSASSCLGSGAIFTKSQFQLPRGPAKHARKATPDGSRQEDERYGLIRKEWKNLNILDVAVMDFANSEIQAINNGSRSSIVTEPPDNSLERIRSSTPELLETNKTIVVTPKSTKKSRSTKRSRSSTTKLGTFRPDTPNGEKVGPTSPSTKIKGSPSGSSSTPSSRQSWKDESLMSNELIGKDVFAKWSDNKYYPGTVKSKSKTKYRVLFYDGQHKLIIEDFIVPMPATLSVGLSVYATSNQDDYGRCGIIVDVKKIKDKVRYVVETDEREIHEVEMRDIFLTNDQVQVLREERNAALKSPPSTPKHLGKVTLDNVVEGTRRSKRIGTPVGTPIKIKRARASLADDNSSSTRIDISKPSFSGVSAKTQRHSSVKYNFDTTSDSNCSIIIDETELLGVQPETIGTQNDLESIGGGSSNKGPSRIKGKARKKSENAQVIATLGPMPENSKLFAGMSFLLSCASLDSLDRFQNKDSDTETGTENEEEWSRKPFARDRLTGQLIAGGGKVYKNFEDLPPNEYDSTKLIANVPNVTKKSLLCLSVGIKAYNHQWVIRCCQENKIVNPSEEELPAGWSLLKKKYVEMYQRRNKKPFETLPVIVVIPNTPADKDFVSFWQQICENAGAAVLLPDNPDDGFGEGTVVVTNRRCPSWIIENANNWRIPIMSTTWLIQCLIEGEICTYDAHPSFAYDNNKQPASHISRV